MSSPRPHVFLEAALDAGRRLVRASLRHGGRATWIGEDVTLGARGWQPTVRTLAADLAAGTAGVGWFLARLGAVAPETDVTAVAEAALRHSLDRGEALLAAQLGWYEGALGVAWAAIDAGRVLGSGELLERGERLAKMSVDAVVRRAGCDDTGLVGGEAGVVAGLLAVACAPNRDEVLAAADGPAERLARSEHQTTGSMRAGLARGWSGVGLALAAWSAATSQTVGREPAARAFRREREWFEPGAGWLSHRAHDWARGELSADRSWCGGAAGIGSARLAAYAAYSSIADLAEVGAAIEIVRAGMIEGREAGASLCHGTAGEIGLLIDAGVLLAEPAHHAAAQRAGLALMEGGRAGTRRVIGPGVDVRDPSLLSGLAGIGLTLLRLHDPAAAPSPTLPPFLVPNASANPAF